jgi:predicted RNA methylase
MTDRVNMLFVALEKDTRDDDIESLITAIKQLRGVAEVKTRITDPTDFIQRSRIKREFINKFLEILDE